MKAIDPAERKRRSIAFLNELGVPVLESLPVIETADEIALRDAPEVARRALCLMLVSDVARSASPDDCRDYLRRNGLHEHLSRAERAFIEGEDQTKQTRVNLSWRCEAAYILLWALGKFTDLPVPSLATDVDEMYPHLPPFAKSPRCFIHDAKLIDKERILDQSDLVYRMHWATRQASLEGNEFVRLNQQVVQEWHHGINWVTCYGDEDWDDVTTDT